MFNLHGLAGVGKTQLARKFAEVIGNQYDALVEIPMGGTTKPLETLEAMETVVAALNPGSRKRVSEAGVKNELVTLMRSHKTLVLLDDVRDAEQIKPFFETDGSLLITSRQRIDIGEESFQIGGMTDSDAVSLIESNGGKERIGEIAALISHETGNLPLALKLVRGYLISHPSINVATFASVFREEKLSYLDEITTSLGISYNGLSPELQKYWRQLAVFPGSFEAGGASAVWEVSNSQANLILDELRSQSLIETQLYSDANTLLGQENPEFIYFRLHDLVREFADTKISNEEREQAEYRHSRHYAYLITRFNDHIEHALTFFDFERHNVETGFERAGKRLDSADHLNLCLAYTGSANDFLPYRLHPQKLLDWDDIGIDAATRIGDTHAVALRLNNKGIALNLLGRNDEAISCLNSALEFAKQNNLRESEARTLSNLGMCYDSIRELDKAIEVYEKAAQILEADGNEALLTSVLSNLGVPLNKLGRFEDALVTLERVLELARKYKNRLKEGIALSTLAETYEELGQPQKSLEVSLAALEIARAYGDRLGEGIRLGNIGNWYLKRRDIVTARQCWNEAVSILDEISSPSAENYRHMLRITEPGIVLEQMNPREMP